MTEQIRPTDDLELGGVKADLGKTEWHLLPWDAVEEVVKVLMYGKRKYTSRNWEKGMDWDRLFDASMRHKIDWWQRLETNAPDSNIKHLAHECCNNLFLLAYELRNKGTDTRPTVPPFALPDRC